MPLTENTEHKVIAVSDLGENVRQARKLQGLSQSDLAALSGVGIRFISELENGKESIHLGKSLIVLKALGLTLSLSKRDWRI